MKVGDGMIAAASLQSECQQRLKKMHKGDVLQVLTWKGDRGFTVTCTGEDCFTLVENGFQNQTQVALTRPVLLKALKPLARREFPRSNKLRLTLTKEENSYG